jgi:KDO2-lipid IV(A) lauroyltransferase
LRLILGIIPRVPRAIVPAIAVPTTALCIATMGNERRAARRNLARILGTRGASLSRATWRLFYNFSKFMVAYCELRHLSAEEARTRLSPDPEGTGRITSALAGGKGVVVLTAHLGNWEMGLRMLESFGVPVNVVMQVDPESGVETRLLSFRQNERVRVIEVGDDASFVLSLRAALARNEILAVQGDRASGAQPIASMLFGAPFSLPLGPFLLAYRTGAPILAAFVVQDGWWRFRSEIAAPIRFPETGDRDEVMRAAAASYAGALESIVRRYPDQWFNFYDLWPESGEKGVPCPIAAA